MAESSVIEVCRQCGQAFNGLLPVVAIQKLNSPEEAGEALMTDGDFAAWPVCSLCHQAPKIKAAFFYRKDASIGLWGAANLTDLGM